MSRLDFSVLLSVYRKEKHEFLYRSLQSIWSEQTLKPTEIVLVKDGPLTPELDRVIADFQAQTPMKIVALSENQGLGKALNAGLKECSYDLVARMDSDDISKPERFAMQLKFMTEHPDIAVCGSWVDEFIDSPDNVVSQRRLPESSAELAAFGRKRNPLNHPTVIFRKSAVEAVGGYEHFPLLEDYWLWIRMLSAGYRFHNIPKSLLWFRTSTDVYRRRGGWRYAMTELKFQNSMRNLGYISLADMIINGSTRFAVRILPNSIRKTLYTKIARK